MATGIQAANDQQLTEKVLTEDRGRIAELELALAELTAHNQNLLAQKKRLQDEVEQLFEGPIGSLILDAEGAIQKINEAAARILGSPKANLLDQSLIPFVAKKCLPVFMDHLRQGRLTNAPLKTELILCPDNQPARSVALTSVRYENPDTRQSEFRLMIVDVPSLAQQPAFSREQNAYEKLLHLIDGIIWECDPHTHHFTFVSYPAQNFLGFPAESWRNASNFWDQQIHPEDREAVLNRRCQACRSQTGYVLEYRMRASDNRIFWFRDTAKIHRDEHGNAILCGITLNITELKEVQLEVQNVNASLENRIVERTAELEDSLRSMESFCYSIAHDLRAPVRGMQGFATALIEDYENVLDEEGKEYARRIIASSRRMDELIGDLLAYGQILHRDIPCVRIDLNATFQKVLQDLTLEITSTGATVCVEPNLPAVQAHEPVLRQVLMNLLTNAIKFVSPDTKPQVRVWTEPREGWVRIWVEDNGIGIDAEHRDRIFRVFERLHCSDKYPGTGIGLALVKKGTERMRGSVGMESGSKQGSRFWVELRKAKNA